MFHNHDTAFAQFDPAITPAADNGPCTTLSAQTRVETERGWVAVQNLRAGDAVATYDGGFVPITAIRPTGVTSAMVHVPGGVLSTCSDVALPGDSHVVLDLPGQSALVTVPLNALCGWRGIRPTLQGAAELSTIHFDSEELIYAQTGLLIHAAPDTTPFFTRLSYGDTRAKLTLLAAGFGAPDTAAA